MFARVRITLTVVLVVIFVVLYASTGTSIYALMRSETMREIDVGILARAGPFETKVVHKLLRGDENGLRSIFRQFVQQQPPTTFFAAVRNTSGTLLTTSDTNIAQMIYKPVISSQVYRTRWQTFNLKKNQLHLRVADIPLYNPNTFQLIGELQFGQRMNPEITSLARLQHVLIEVGVLGLIGAILAGFYVSGLALRPIRRSWQRQQQFVADASHELRTPLAVIQSNLDIVLGHGAETVEHNFEWLNTVKAESRRLSRLIADLLTLAKADSNERLVEMKVIDWAEVNHSAFEALLLFGQAKGLQMSFTVKKDVQDASSEGEMNALEEHSSQFLILGDADRLYQLAFILLDNAIKYTSTGEIHVRMRVIRNHHIVFEVKDTGEGIAEEDKQHIFDRFYRGDRARATDGSGLGLSIAKWIVESHHGRIDVESKVGAGTRFRVTVAAVKNAR